MLATVLQDLHARGRLTPGLFVEATGRDHSTLYRYLAGSSQPSYHTIQQLFAHCDDEEIQLALLADFTRGVAIAFSHIPAELDIDGDGDVNMDDVLEAAIAANFELAEWLQDIQKATHDGKVTQVELIQADTLGRRVIASVLAALGILDHIAERQGRRRQARPFNHNSPGRGGRGNQS